MANSKATDMDKQAEEVASVLKMMAHPTRLKLLCAMVEGEKSVQELTEATSASQVSVSQFLKIMRAEGILENRKEGSFVYYSICEPKVLKIISSLYSVFCGRKK